VCYSEASYGDGYFGDEFEIRRPQANEIYVVDINSLTKDDFERSDVIFIDREDDS